MEISRVESSNLKSFWTICYSCSMQYEYLKSCKDQIVKCVNCSNPFEAIECPVPSMVRDDNPWSYEKQQQRRKVHGEGSGGESKRKELPLPSRNVEQKRTKNEDEIRIRGALLAKANNLLKVSLERYAKTSES